jgi:hypothetical protein
LAYEGDADDINEKLNIKSDIDTIFRQAQSVYNAWCKLPEEERTTNNLLQRLDFDFFEVLDSVTIARSRKHIKPIMTPLISVRSPLGTSLFPCARN